MRLKPLWFVLAAVTLLAACQRTPPEASLALTATVGTVAGECADDSEITLATAEPQTVYYCYTITNTGFVAIPAHALADDQFGVILRDFAFDLDLGASVDTVAAGVVLEAEIAATTTNAAVWDGFRLGERLATAEASTTVNVVPPTVNAAVAGTFVADGNGPTVGPFDGNILLIGMLDLDGEPLLDPVGIDITVPGLGTFAYTFDPTVAIGGIVALILADFEAGLTATALGGLGIPVEVVELPADPGLRSSAAVGGDFVFAFPGETLVRSVDTDRKLDLPAVLDVEANPQRDVLTVDFVDHDDPEVEYRVDAFGRGLAAFTGTTLTDASPAVVELSGALEADEPFVVDVLALRGDPSAVFESPVQIDVAEYLYYSE